MASTLESATKRRSAPNRRAFHVDESRAFKMLYNPLRDDLRHDLVCIVDALAAVKAQRESEGGGEVRRIGGCEALLRSIILGQLAGSRERNKNLFVRSLNDAQAVRDGEQAGI